METKRRGKEREVDREPKKDAEVDREMDSKPKKDAEEEREVESESVRMIS